MFSESRLGVELILKYETCGLYYKHIAIVNDASRVNRIMMLSDTTTWSVTYDHN
jgi:hypothetical protein